MNILFTRILLLLLVLCASCNRVSTQVPSHTPVWTKKWQGMDSGRIKAGVITDDKGSLMVVGQCFHYMDSIDYTSMLALLSPSGEVVKEKLIGRYGEYKGAFRRKMDQTLEERLVELFKTKDNRILALGYKVNKRSKADLWIVEINDSLEVLRDSVYKDIEIERASSIKGFPTEEGFHVLVQKNLEENNVWRSSQELLTFDSNLELKKNPTELSFIENEKRKHISFCYDVVEHNQLLFLCGFSADSDMPNDFSKGIGCVVAYNPMEGKTMLLHQFEEHTVPHCISFHENGDYVVVAKKTYAQSDWNKATSNILVVAYDKMHHELWRDEQQFGKHATPNMVAYRADKIEVYGNSLIAKSGVVFFELTYDTSGKLITKWQSDFAWKDREVVCEIAAPNDRMYRLLIDEDWRIDAFDGMK